jgi:hypothetical protein
MFSDSFSFRLHFEHAFGRLKPDRAAKERTRSSGSFTHSNHWIITFQ